MAGKLSLRQRLFTGPETKQLADTIDAGIVIIEEGLSKELHLQMRSQTFLAAISSVPAANVFAPC